MENCKGTNWWWEKGGGGGSLSSFEQGWKSAGITSLACEVHLGGVGNIPGSCRWEWQSWNTNICFLGPQRLPSASASLPCLSSLCTMDTRTDVAREQTSLRLSFWGPGSVFFYVSDDHRIFLELSSVMALATF